MQCRTCHLHFFLYKKNLKVLNMHTNEIDRRLEILEKKINYILDVVLVVKQTCFRMDRHIDFIESFGVKNTKKNIREDASEEFYYDPGV